MSFDELFKTQVPTAEQFHALVKFVDHGSLAKAFGQGKSAQTNATQQLSRIDGCLGIRTRKSSGSTKIPTDEARELALFARDFFQKLEDFKLRTDRKPNSFVIGSGESLTFFLLLPALARAGNWRRSIELHLQNLRSHEIVTGLLNGSVDLGLVRTTAIKKELLTKKRVKIQPLGTLTYAFYVHKSALKKFAGKIEDEENLLGWLTENVPLATFWGEQSTFTAALAKSNLRWRPQLRCESFPQVKEAVVSGGYCGILPSVAFSPIPQEVLGFGSHILKTARREIALAWSSTLTGRRPGGEVALRELLPLLQNK